METTEGGDTRSGWLLETLHLHEDRLRSGEVGTLTLLRREGPTMALHQMKPNVSWTTLMPGSQAPDFHLFRAETSESQLDLNWGTFSELLTSSELRWPRINLTRSGTPYPPSKYLTGRHVSSGYDISTVDSEGLIDCIHDGATIVVNAVDALLPVMKSLAENLEYVFETHIQINCYASFGADPGFNIHWDDHDVIVIQMEGSKSWTVYGESDVAPSSNDTPLWRGELQRGDLLFVPRGFWHLVKAEQGPSLHVTCSIPLSSESDFAYWMTSELTSGGRAVPLRSSGVNGQRSRHTISAALNHAAQKASEPAALYLFRISHNAKATPRPILDLPRNLSFSADDLTGLSRVTSLLPRITALELTKDYLFVHAHNKSYRFHPDGEAVLRELLTSESSIWGSIVDKFPNTPEGLLRVFTIELWAEGLIRIH